MPPDSTATKKCLLDAAFAEFAERGLAGARVDRIGAAAGVNKRLIYVHFTNKERLFDTVVAHSLERIAEAVPFTPADLPGYAGALFDHVLAHPEHLKLTIWAQLERPRARPPEVATYRAKVDAIAATRPPGDPAALDPVDVLALVIAMATAWLNASPALREVSGPQPFAPERLARHRAALTAAVEALAPLTGSGVTG